MCAEAWPVECYSYRQRPSESVNLLGLAVSLIDLVVTLYIYCTNVSGMLMWVGGVGKYLVGSLYKY